MQLQNVVYVKISMLPLFIQSTECLHVSHLQTQNVSFNVIYNATNIQGKKHKRQGGLFVYVAVPHVFV